jgi:hypothetical protein
MEYYDQNYGTIMKVFETIFTVTDELWNISQHSYYQEIQGIVDGVGISDYTVPKAVILNSFYEFEAWCTSVIVRQTDGSIIHSRNLDGFGASKPEMAAATYNARYH